MALMDPPQSLQTGLPVGILTPKALAYENARAVVAAFFFVTALFAVILFVDVPFLVFLAQWVLLPLCIGFTLLDVLLINRLQHRAYRYMYSASTVEIRRGLLFRSTATIATVQILSVDIAQGPLLKACGVVSVRFRTVGETTTLAPVTRQAAEDIRAQVMQALDGA